MIGLNASARNSLMTMVLTSIHSIALFGMEARSVEVEVDGRPTVRDEVAGLVTVGLPDSAVRESKDRVMGAIRNSGFLTPSLKATVNLGIYVGVCFGTNCRRFVDFGISCGFMFQIVRPKVRWKPKMGNKHFTKPEQNENRRSGN